MDKVKTEIAPIGVINIIFDGWSDRYNRSHCLGLRVQYITNDWIGRVITLSVKKCGQNADSICSHIVRELELFMPDYKQKVLFSNHDGAAVMTKTNKLLKVKEFQHYTANALNLLLMTLILQNI